MITKVLIAEDEEKIREELVECLAADGFECVEASNGEEGLDLLRRDTEITVVLSDILMPGKSGLEMINAAQSEIGLEAGVHAKNLANSTTQCNASGQTVGVVGVGQDITELNKARVVVNV